MQQWLWKENIIQSNALFIKDKQTIEQSWTRTWSIPFEDVVADTLSEPCAVDRAISLSVRLRFIGPLSLTAGLPWDVTPRLCRLNTTSALVTSLLAADTTDCLVLSDVTSWSSCGCSDKSDTLASWIGSMHGYTKYALTLSSMALRMSYLNRVQQRDHFDDYDMNPAIHWTQTRKILNNNIDYPNNVRLRFPVIQIN
jgi:hypothetical protein